MEGLSFGRQVDNIFFPIQYGEIMVGARQKRTKEGARTSQDTRGRKKKVWDICQIVVWLQGTDLCLFPILLRVIIIFYLTSIVQGKSYMFHDAKGYWKYFYGCDMLTQHLLCEFYFHGFIFPYEHEFDFVPYIEDLQL